MDESVEEFLFSTLRDMRDNVTAEMKYLDDQVGSVKIVEHGCEATCTVVFASGKLSTATLNHLKLVDVMAELQEDAKCSFTEVPSTIPTVGTNLSTLTFDRKQEVTLRELGGAMAPIWHTYLSDTQVVIFMVDVSNPAQVSASTILLLTTLASDHLKGAAVLLLLNKTDLPSSLQLNELKYLMGIESLLQTATQTISIMECSVKEGTGLKEVLVWISENSRNGAEKT